jgi:hypothetical protein
MLWMALALPVAVRAQDRRAYEGVVSWKKRTIGTVILVQIDSNRAVSGWILLGKLQPIEQGSVAEDGVEFRVAGNTYRIDERRGRIVYSGPDGEGDRLLMSLTRLSGSLRELAEETGQSRGQIAALEVNGRRRDLRYGTPALWKNQGQPFEKFSRLEELLGKDVSLWVADADLRTGRIVVVEEPEGMDIPLKAPKKPQDNQEKK